MIISEDWQLPAETERETWNRLKGHPVAESQLVMHYPWATLIDCCGDNHEKARNMLWEIQNNFLGGYHRITCCQHIRGFQYSFLFAACGLANVFWPHTTVTQETGYFGLRFHAYPLFPVQRPAVGSTITDESREILVSFKGAYDSRYYLTQARQWIADASWESLQDKKALIEITDEWHFQKDVYERQVKGKALSSSEITDTLERESSYKLLLSQSIFSLCPSGSGPNSIRLWESLGFGSIPVLLADGLSLPWVDAGLSYETGVIPVIEKDSSVSRLPSLLNELSKDGSFLATKRSEMAALWDKYWVDSFARPIIDFISINDISSRRSLSASSESKTKYDFASNLYLHLRGFLHYATYHQTLKRKWPTGFESIVSFILEANHGIDYGADNIKAMLVATCKKTKGISPYVALLKLLDELY